MVGEEKAAFNARAKTSLLPFLNSRTWPEKIRSIERMNAMAETAASDAEGARAGIEFAAAALKHQSRESVSLVPVETQRTFREPGSRIGR